jgi:O-antigen/teichoic acid export membrane protein
MDKFHQQNRLAAHIGIKWLKNLIKEDVGLVYTTVGGLGSSVLGAFFWLVLASILNVDSYGLVNFYIALANILAGVGIIGMNVTVTTYLAKGENKLLHEANSITLISGVVAALVLSVFHWAAGLLSATLIFFSMAQAEMLGKKTYREYAFVLMGQRIAQITLSLLLYFQIGLTGIILGYFIGALIFSYKYLASIRKFTLKFSNLKEKRDFILHSYGYNLIGQQLSNYLDKIIIGALFGYYALGLYQLGFQFFMFLSIIPASLQQYLLPEESSGNQRHRIKLVVLILSIGASIALFLLSPYLVTTFFPTFTDAISLVRLISLSVIPSTIVAILTASFLGNEKSKVVFTAGLIYLTSLIGCLIVLGFIVGVSGLAIAIIIAKTIQAAFLITKRAVTQS